MTAKVQSLNPCHVVFEFRYESGRDVSKNSVIIFPAESKEGREGKDVSCTEELELELEALDITDDPLELEAADEAENEELAKKLLDDQGERYNYTKIWVVVSHSVDY